MYLLKSLFSDKKKIKIIQFLYICILSFLLSSCQKSNIDPKVSEQVEWAIYWYLCGSDLESKHGSASADIDEMLSVMLPEGIKVVIETGGASENTPWLYYGTMAEAFWVVWHTMKFTD